MTANDKTLINSDSEDLQSKMNLTDEMMDVFYEAAREIFMEKRYEAAADAFIFLTTLRPTDHNYWMGLGASEHKVNRHEEALKAYAMATICDPETPIPQFFSSQCYLALNDIESSFDALKMVVEICGDYEEWRDIKKQALAMIATA